MKKDLIRKKDLTMKKDFEENNNEKNIFFSKDERELLEGVDSINDKTIEEKSSSNVSFFVALILLLLTVPYFLLGPEVFSVIEGKTQSTLVTKEVIYKNQTIRFDENVLLQLKTMYFTQSSFEFAACLQGTFKKNEYEITNIFLPRMYVQAFEHVLFQSCPQDSIGMLHSHPYKHCVFSEQDNLTYRAAAQKNKDILMIVMCEENRFGFYRE